MEEEYYSLLSTFDQVNISYDLRYAIYNQLITHYNNNIIFDSITVAEMHIRHGFNDWDKGMAYSVRNEDHILVDFFISKNANN